MTLLEAIEHIRNNDAYKAAQVELEQIREVVTLVAHPKFDTNDKGAIRYYVTKADVRRARALYEKLKV